MSKLEKFIQKNTRNCSQLYYNSACTLRHCITPDKARKAAEIAMEEMLNDICEWIDINYVHYLDVNVKGTLTANIKQFIGDLKHVIRNE